MKKRILSLLLVLVMLLSMLPTVALAAEDEAPHGSCGENATWRYDAETQTLTISGTGPMTDYDSDTPEFGEYSEVVCILSLIHISEPTRH